MLPFLRSDLTKLAAYTPHPGGQGSIPLDQLDTNESPEDLPLGLKEKLAHLQQQIPSNRYPDGSHAQLKTAIAEYVNESAALGTEAIAPSHISVGNGSDELIRSLLIATCLGEHRSILVAPPTFSMYGILAQTLGIPVHGVERQENFAINLIAAQRLIKQAQPPVRVVFVVHPNSPTANPLIEAELEWLRGLDQQILVVIDEAYFEFHRASVVGELSQHPNWVVLRTFSKAFRLAAYRVGYAIAHPEMIAALEKVRLPYNLPALSQAAALLALKERHQLLPAIDTILSERDRLYNALSSHPDLQVWSSAANFIYLRLIPASVDLAQVAAALKAQGTLVRHTGGGIRITVGNSPENTRTISRLQKVLASKPLKTEEPVYHSTP